MENKEEISLKQNLENKKLEKYRLELSEDIKVSVSNIMDKSLRVSSLRQKWLNYYFSEKEVLAKIKKAKEKYIKKKMPNAGNSLLPMKTSDKLNEDETLKKINVLSEEVKEIIEYLQYVMNIMNDFGFQIKNSIEIYKLERS